MGDLLEGGEGARGSGSPWGSREAVLWGVASGGERERSGSGGNRVAVAVAGAGTRERRVPR